MKRLLVLRHAKSEYIHGIKDHSRGINSRGKNDSKLIGNWLKANIKKPELIICSTATRTRMTLGIILKETGDEFGRFTSTVGHQLVLKSGANQTFLTASNTNATFNNNVNVI